MCVNFHLSCCLFLCHQQYAHSEIWPSTLSTSDYFFGCCLMGKRTSFELVTESIKQIVHHRSHFLKEKSTQQAEASSSASSSSSSLSIELMIHPGYASSTGDEFSRSSERQHELQVIIDARWAEWCTANNITVKSCRPHAM
jgi:hypothetical protein